MQVLNEFDKENEFNNFYKRFDLAVSGSIDKCSNLLSSVTCDSTQDRTEVDPSAVTKIFKRLRTKTSRGPDGISAFT